MTKEEKIVCLTNNGAKAKIHKIEGGYVIYRTIISGIDTEIVEYSVPLNDTKTTFEHIKNVDDIIQWID
jgi:hypothetical protein